MLVAEDSLRVGRSFDEGTARGATRRPQSDLRLLSIPATAELAQLLSGMWVSGILPDNAVATLMTFIPKQSKGHRGIALLDALYTALLAARRPMLVAWAAKHTAFWDDAVRGSTPLRAALCRHTLLEAATPLQLPCALALWGIDAFFVRFSVVDVVRIAIRLKHSQRFVLMTLQLLTSPRPFTVGGGTTPLGSVSSSVLASDPPSMVFAKLITYELLAATPAAYGSAAARNYVEDMPMMVIELIQAALLQVTQPAALQIAKELAVLGSATLGNPS